MKKLYSFLLFLLLLGSGIVNAQQWTIVSCSSGPPSSTVASTYGPMYSVATANATNRTAVIYPASQLAGLTGSVLTNAFFHRSTTASMAGTPNFKIYLKEVSATDWGSGSLTWTNEITNATLVYNGNPAPIVGNAVGWVNFPFTTNFPYSGTQNLAVFMEYTNPTASSAITWSYDFTSPCVNTSNSNTTKYSNNTTGTLPATLASSEYRRPYIGFDYTYPPCIAPPTAGSAYASNATPCFGQSISLNLSGNSFGSGQTYQWEKSASVSGPWLPEGSAQTTSPLITVTPPVGTTYYRCQVTCGASTVTSVQDTVIVPTPFPGGTYTINSAQPTGSGNFQSFTDAFSAMGCGISGPIVLNVVPGSGPYNEQINIPATLGSSASNTLRVNGNGATVQYNASATYQGVLMMDAVKYVTFDSLTFKSLNATNGSGAILYNGCDHDTLIRCTFDLTSVTGTASTNFGIRISSTSSGTSTTVSGAINTYIARNSILGYSGSNNGIYYGIYAYGPNTNNIYEHNLISNTYLYGTYFYYGNGNIIHANKVTRETKISTGYCYGLITGNLTGGSQVTNNRVEYLGGATNNASYCYPLQMNSTAGTSTAPVLVANNIVSNMTSVPLNGGIYINGGSYVDVYHNTVSIDLPLTYSTTTNQSGISSSSTTANIKNNIVSYTGGGPNTKYGLYLGGVPASCDYNNIYMNSVVSGTQYYGYRGSNYTTFAAFQSATTYEVNGHSVDPMFASPSTGDVTPTNSLIDNMGTPVGIATDIKGIARSATTPDLGAIEFSVSGCAGTPVAGTASVAGNITSACIGGTANFSLSGFSIGSGISIQWEESPSGAGFWTPVSGATGSSYTATITGATDYRAVVTCANGGGFDVSNTITININPFFLCYCSPNTGVTLHGTTSNYITNVAIANTGLNSPSSAVGAGGYTQKDYTVAANTTTLTQGQTYTLNATISSATYGAELWIDWDQNGLFDTSEYYLMPTGITSTTISVPLSAIPGLTGMRIRTIASTTVFYDKTGACANVTTGSETEDYVITIAQGIPCSGIPSTTGTITSLNTSLCNGMTTSFTLTGFPTELGISYQWESSPAGQNNFNPIAGATGFTYTSGPLSASTDFRVAVICNNPGGGTGYTNIETITVNNPQLASTNGATRCGTGTVTLSATASGGNSINWYANATGGVPLDTGISFTTPVITGTTTFYAAANTSGGSANLGPLNLSIGTYATWASTAQWFNFTVLSPTTIQSFDMFWSAAVNSAFSIVIRDATTLANVFTYNGTTTVTGTTTPQTIPLNAVLQPGNYQLNLGTNPGTYRNSTGAVYPYTIPGVISITGNTFDVNYYYMFYNWIVGAGCEGSRVPVIATVTAPPAYTVSASPDTVCLGGSSTVSVNSANNYTYTWTPSGSGSSFSVSPSTTTKYYLSGIDGNSCGIYDSVTVNVKSAPASAAVVASPDVVCVTGSTTLTLTPTPMYGIGIEWEKNTGSGFVTIPGANGNTYTEPISATASYRAKMYCNSTLITTSSEDTVTYSNPTIAQTIPGSRCGTGPVTLAAIGAPAGATIKWYAAATGGTALATGNAFTTPSISATTDYYAAPTFGGGLNTLGLANRVSTTTNNGYSDVGLMFDATVPFTLSSVAIYPVATTPSGNVSATIALKNSAGTILQTATVSVPTSTSPGVKTVVPLNFAVPAGTDHRLVFTSATGGGITGFIREITTGFTYPYSIPGVATITSAYTGGASSSYYYYFYDWQVVTGCEGTRVPVTATINPAASGTGLATGGTTVGTSQLANTTESYTDACNDTVAVVASGSTALGTTSAIVLTSASVPTHQNKPFVPRAYDINPATDGPATVTLYALQSEFTAYNSYVTGNSLNLPLLPTGPSDLTGMGNIVITQYHGSASAGTQGPLGLYSSANVDFIQNSSITVTPVGNYWKLTFPVTGFSGFFIHTGANPLAIDLKNISAVNMGNRNRVDWTTGTEQSGDGFELERSADGTHFRKLAEIAAKGQASGYSYWDETPVTGVNYYRLKMVDASGKGTYSKVVTATVKSGNFTVEAYPNPVKDVLTVKVFGVQGKDATVSITDITGKVIRTETMSADKTTLEMSGLAQGMYLIKYADSDHSQTIKVNKQ